ncbi:MAG: AAA family ATPase [Candidatus Pacebacteria bacterium]|jgi:hypothetical protein|nr:AAA family ATPase [Candidatus Paceibacterota bacterium]
MTQQQAFEILKSGKNAFITGPAGSGKTYLLNRYIGWLKDCGINAAVTASTGIAATHLGGITLHSWTGLGVREELTESDAKDLVKRGYLRRRFLGNSVLIIDEVSMLAGNQLDLADRLFRLFKQVNAPFGGVQVVLCGDFFQLPPISRKKEFAEFKEMMPPQMRLRLGESIERRESDGPDFAFKSQAWKDLDLKICYLDEQHRQSDDEYLNALSAIRGNVADGRVRQFLQNRIDASLDMEVVPTKLYTHNADVDIENDQELEKLDAKEFRYRMELIGPAALAEKLQKGCLAPANLRLKIGARVMFCKNNFEEGYVNGTLGVVEKLGEERVMVRVSSGALMDVGPASWHVAEDGDIKAEIVQYPLRLAWAITVHKSQGMSLDAAYVDLRQSFEPGMGYVALSRVRSSKGLALAGFNDMALRVNPEILAFDEKLKQASEEHGKMALPAARVKPAALAIPKKKKLDTVARTKEMVLKGMELEAIARERSLNIGTIIDHCEKIKETNPAVDFSRLAASIPFGQLIAMKAALKKGKTDEGQYPLKPAMLLIGDGVSYDQLRLARLLI